MKARLLYLATVAVALASTFAYADETRPLTRAEVVAQYRQAAADGTLQKTDYDYDRQQPAATSTRTRADVVAELDAARHDHALIGPWRDKSYNSEGKAMLQRSSLARAEVKAEVRAAREEGTLHHTEYNDEATASARPAGARKVL
jgi:hypothetical protein